MLTEIQQYGYRPMRTWHVRKSSGKRIVEWMAVAPDTGDWQHGFDDGHVSGIFNSKQEAVDRCLRENIDNWGITAVQQESEAPDGE